MEKQKVCVSARISHRYREEQNHCCRNSSIAQYREKVKRRALLLLHLEIEQVVTAL